MQPLAMFHHWLIRGECRSTWRNAWKSKGPTLSTNQLNSMEEVSLVANQNTVIQVVPMIWGTMSKDIQVVP